jgi:hypothetical protein
MYFMFMFNLFYNFFSITMYQFNRVVLLIKRDESVKRGPQRHTPTFEAKGGTQGVARWRQGWPNVKHEGR